VLEIVALDEVDVTVQVVEDYVGRLQQGMPVRVTIDAVPDRVFTGTVHRIVPSADVRGRTFPVKVRLPNERVGESVLLKAGMFASATLAVEEPMPALLVPKDAVVIGGLAPLQVWVVDPQSSTAKLAPVQLGVAKGDMIQVLGPVQPGDKVVVRGNERIMFPGQPLKVIER
jgi:RND family efflux transporter MFP subunit